VHKAVISLRAFKCSHTERLLAAMQEGLVGGGGGGRLVTCTFRLAVEPTQPRLSFLGMKWFETVSDNLHPVSK
jgi:hypothetical protein